MCGAPVYAPELSSMITARLLPVYANGVSNPITVHVFAAMVTSPLKTLLASVTVIQSVVLVNAVLFVFTR